MDELRFVDACTEEHFKAMSLIHALGWRDTYAEAVPADYMAREITDDRWVEVFRQNYESQNGVRSEERRGGKECVRTGRSRWSPSH